MEFSRNINEGMYNIGDEDKYHFCETKNYLIVLAPGKNVGCTYRAFVPRKSVVRHTFHYSTNFSTY